MITKKVTTKSSPKPEPVVPTNKSSFNLISLTNAIRQHFGRFEPTIVKFLWTASHGREIFRVNWFDGKEFVYSRFVGVSSSPEGFILEDLTKGQTQCQN